MVPAAYAGAFALRFAGTHNATPNFKGGILMDDAFFRAAFPRSHRAYLAWQAPADVALGTSIAWTVADPLLVGAATNWDVGSQMLLINFEGYATYSLLLWGSQALVRRRKPIDSPCDGADGPGNRDRCDSQMSVRSFIGGHVGVVATAASLTCLNHMYVPAFGGGIRDAFPCAFWVAATAVTFTSRSVTGSHYLSDNMLGVGVGGFSGFVVPWLLHYMHGPKPWPALGSVAGLHVTGAWVNPSPLGDGATAGVSGWW